MDINYDEIAKKHGLSVGAIRELAAALQRGHGRAAQFNHPELGGMGQWMQGGMVMVGDMNNHALKAKVAQICEALSGTISGAASFEMPPMPSAVWWPPEYGQPNMVGEQNAMRYAYFAKHDRLVLLLHDKISIYVTSGYHLTGVSQQQSSRTHSIAFHSDKGIVSLEDFDHL